MTTVTPHAAMRLSERYRGVVSKESLVRAVQQRDYWTHVRQTVSRSLCSTVLRYGIVYFILNRKQRRVITVLNRRQAKQEIEKAGRSWPPRRGKRILVYLVQLLKGPDTGCWDFAVLKQPEGEQCYSFSVPAEVGLSGDYILELAWNEAPEPNKIRDILLDEELEKLFDPEPNIQYRR